MDQKWRETLFERAKQLDIVLSKEQIDKFDKYFQLLIEKNKVMNLTAITEPYDVIEKHFIDSLSIVKAISLEKNSIEAISKKKIQTVLDLGTGAGFPGIPLKIAFPHLKITLVDSLNKRIKFLNEVIEELGLEEIEAIHARAEDIAKKEEHREQYDLCVSRAVANLSTLSEYCVPFIHIGGLFTAYKGENVEEEMQGVKKALDILGAEIERIEQFTLPGSDIERKMVLIRKKRKTPKKYPRKAGLPSKEPLFAGKAVKR